MVAVPTNGPVSQSRFPLGKIVATPGALEALQLSEQSPAVLLDKHVHGDWGDVSEGDKQANEEALRDGSRILSAYITSAGTRIWVITEAADESGHRLATTVLLPEEY